MRYTVKESMEEVRKRAERVRRRRERKRLGLFSLGACALLLILTLNLATSPLTPADGSSDMGSFLLEAKNGGIVAALILAVLLVVLITLFFLRKRRNEPPEQSARKSNQHTEGGKNHE